jgi:general stress protein YciG
MAGTHAGGVKAADTNKRRYGDDFYDVIGRMGGQSGDPTRKGFAANRALAIEAGRKGGKAPRRSAAYA